MVLKTSLLSLEEIQLSLHIHMNTWRSISSLVSWRKKIKCPVLVLQRFSALPTKAFWCRLASPPWKEQSLRIKHVLLGPQDSSWALTQFVQLSLWAPTVQQPSQQLNDQQSLSALQFGETGTFLRVTSYTTINHTAFHMNDNQAQRDTFWGSRNSHFFRIMRSLIFHCYAFQIFFQSWQLSCNRRFYRTPPTSSHCQNSMQSLKKLLHML